MDNFNQLIDIKYNLMNEKRILENQIKEIEKEIDFTSKKTVDVCSKETGHDWIREREYCYDGNTYYYCKFCGKDKFSQCIFYVQKPVLSEYIQSNENSQMTNHQ